MKPPVWGFLGGDRRYLWCFPGCSRGPERRCSHGHPACAAHPGEAVVPDNSAAPCYVSWLIARLLSASDSHMHA